MTNCQMYGCIAAFMPLLLTKVLATINMKTEEQVHRVNIGETVDLRCEFESERFELFENPPVWKKIQMTEKSDINIMSVIKKPFLNTGRFEVSHLKRGSKSHSFHLRIRDMRQEDSGNYTCEILGSGAKVLAHVTHYIMVKVPVDTLFITTSKETRYPIQISERVLEYTEGYDNTLRCISIGGYPPPLMRIYLACIHHEQNRRREITDKLRWDQTFKLSGQKSLRNITYYSIRWSYEFEVEPSYDACELTCAVNLPGVQQPPTYAASASAVLHVKYAPVIKCPNTTAFPGDQHVSLRCEVRAKPPLISTNWVLDDTGLNISEHGEIQGDYWIYNKVDDPREPAPFITQLFMRTAKDSSFRTYTFIAENEIGVSRHHVTLALKKIPKAPSLRSSSHRTPATPIYEPVLGSATSQTVSKPVTSLITFVLFISITQRLWTLENL